MQRLLFANRTALVTGAGGGLGKSYALELAKRGCNVVVNDLGGLVNGKVTVSATSTGSKQVESDGLHAVVAEIKAMGGSAIADTNNVLDAKDIIANAMKHFGTVDIIVNNAGILRDRSFHKMTEEDFKTVLDVHLLGSFRMCHEAWPIMQKQNYGRIVNVSSGAATYGNFGQANYAAAKLGILGMSNVLAKEGAKNNIYVNTIVPVAASRMTENLLSEELLAQMDPKHVTPIVAYLAHESNTNTGQVYEIGGGWYSTIRWQRSQGVLLGGRAEGAKEEKVATAEEIAANMEAISDFSIGECAYPTSPTDAITAFTTMLESGSYGVPAADTVAASTTSATPANTASSNGGAGAVMKPIDTLHSTGLFTALNNAVIKDDVIRGKLMTDIKALIVFEIIAENSDDVVNNWVFNCTGKEVLGKTDMVQVQRQVNDEGVVTPPVKIKYDAKIICSDSTFSALSQGKMSPEVAYMRGILKIKGQLNAALKVKTLLAHAATMMK